MRPDLLVDGVRLDERLDHSLGNHTGGVAVDSGVCNPSVRSVQPEVVVERSPQPRAWAGVRWYVEEGVLLVGEHEVCTCSNGCPQWCGGQVVHKGVVNVCLQEKSESGQTQARSRRCTTACGT